MSKPFHILIVDDDPHVHTILSKVLLAPTYILHAAADAAAAYQTLTQITPDLVLLDLMMPKISGIDVLSHIRQTPHLTQTKILILSAKDSQEDRLDGLTHGADDYESKPFHVRALVRKIEHMLQVHPLHPPA